MTPEGRVKKDVKVHLDFAKALPAEFGQVIKQLGPVFLGRIEKRVLRRLAIDIPKAGKLRVVLQPVAEPRWLEWCAEEFRALARRGRGISVARSGRRRSMRVVRCLTLDLDSIDLLYSSKRCF